MVMDKRGIIYFAESAINKLASIDPETMKITEYVLPIPMRACAVWRLPRMALSGTATMDADIWAASTLTPARSPSGLPSGPYSEPYALTTVGSIIWYAETGMKQNTIVRFDPATEKFQTWLIPSGGGVVRNMMPDKNGNVWIAGSGVKTIGDRGARRPFERAAELEIFGVVPQPSPEFAPDLTTADIMVETLIAWGATHCFGVVGDGINSIIEALRKRQDRIQYIGVRHEEAAAFMARASPNTPVSSASASAPRVPALSIFSTASTTHTWTERQSSRLPA